MTILQKLNLLREKVSTDTFHFAQLNSVCNWTLNDADVIDVIIESLNSNYGMITDSLHDCNTVWEIVNK